MVAYRVNQHSKKLAGVYSKLVGQLESFKDSGFEVYALFMSLSQQVLVEYDQDEFRIIKRWQNISVAEEKKLFWTNAIEALIACNPDVIYTRYDKMYEQGYLTDFFKSSLAQKCIRCLELATYPYADEIRCPQLRASDAIHFTQLIEDVDVLYSTSTLKTIQGKVNHHFDNQLAKSAFVQCSQSQTSLIGRDGIIRILSVANVSDWHGFDRILYGLADYIQTNPSQPVQYHVVGEGDNIGRLKELAGDLGLHDYVVFEGQRGGTQLINSYDMASIGVGCLGIHRKGLAASSTLKVRECLANGLPVFYASHDALLENIPFALKVSDNDDGIDIPALINFVRECDNQADIRNKIRQFAYKAISWRKLTDNVMKKVKSIQLKK